MSEIFELFIPGYVDMLTEAFTYFVGVFVAGVLVAFIAWVIGYTVNSVYRWLSDTTKER